jgi:hypothetical protein
LGSLARVRFLFLARLVPSLVQPSSFLPPSRRLHPRSSFQIDRRLISFSQRRLRSFIYSDELVKIHRLFPVLQRHEGCRDGCAQIGSEFRTTLGGSTILENGKSKMPNCWRSPFFFPLPNGFETWHSPKNGKGKIANCWRCSKEGGLCPTL